MEKKLNISFKRIPLKQITNGDTGFFSKKKKCQCLKNIIIKKTIELSSNKKKLKFNVFNENSFDPKQFTKNLNYSPEDDYDSDEETVKKSAEIAKNLIKKLEKKINVII